MNGLDGNEPATKEFEIKYIEQMKVLLDSQRHEDRIQLKYHSDPYTITYKRTAFSDLGAFPGDTTEMDDFERDSYGVGRPQSYMLQDAEIHTQYGAVTIDGFAARESLFHFPWHIFPHYSASGPQYREVSCRLPDRASVLSISDGYALHSGIHENYYHWIVLFLTRLNSVFLNDWQEKFDGSPVLLLPFFRDVAQRQSAEALAAHFKLPILNITEDVTIKVKRLLHPQPAPSGGLKPHPFMKESFSLLRAAFYEHGDYPKKIYVTRRDTKIRRLLNESELESRLEAHGYTIVSLTGKTFAEQVNLFAHAKKIIGGHGAGLTNLAFCEPGTAVLEVQMPSHLNWCYRRLATMLELDYGYFYGEVPADIGCHTNLREYLVDVDRLEASLASGL